MKFEEFILNEYNHTFRNQNHVLQDIFKDFWEPFCNQNSNLNIRPIVFTEIQKFIGCGSIDNGFSFYECSDCGNYIFVPFTCKSRFCTSCDVNSSIKIFSILCMLFYHAFFFLRFLSLKSIFPII